MQDVGPEQLRDRLENNAGHQAARHQPGRGAGNFFKRRSDQ